MADRILMVAWGTPVRGRETLTHESFNDAMGLWSRLTDSSRIERFDAVLLEPNPNLNGFFLLHGSHDQLAALREDDEFQRTIVSAGLIVDDMHVVEGRINEGVGPLMAMWQEAVGKVPQSA